MTNSTIVLTASRFGGSYLLDLFWRARPDAVVLQDIFSQGSSSLDTLTGLLDRSDHDIVRAAENDPAGLWTDIRQACRRTGSPVIAKVYYYHQPRDSALWSELAGNSRIIHLIRRNLFDAYLSRLSAEQNKLWQIQNAAQLKQLSKPVHIPPAKLRHFVRERTEQVRWARRRFAAADYTELAFEDIVAGPMTCAREIDRIVGPRSNGSRPMKIESGRVRIKRRSNADAVQNYSEVAHLDRMYL